MANAIASQVQALYVGYLGRAADQAGLDFWTNAIANGTSTIESVALGFTLSQEYQAQYADLNTRDLVGKVYENVLGRAADADGLAFWVGEIEKGVISADTLVASIINSLGAIDQKVIDNKVFVANAYTAAAGSNYDAQAGAAAIAKVDGTAASVSNALATIESGSLPGSVAGVSVIQGLYTAQQALAAFEKANAGAVDKLVADFKADAETTASADVAKDALFNVKLDAVKADAAAARSALGEESLAVVTAQAADAQKALDAVVAKLSFAEKDLVSKYNAAVAADKAATGATAEQEAAAIAGIDKATGFNAALKAAKEAGVEFDSEDGEGVWAAYVGKQAVTEPAAAASPATEADRAKIAEAFKNVAFFSSTFKPAADAEYADLKAEVALNDATAKLMAADNGQAYISAANADAKADQLVADVTAADAVKAQVDALVQKYADVNKEVTDYTDTTTGAIDKFNAADASVKIADLDGDVTAGAEVKETFFFADKVAASDDHTITGFAKGDAIYLGSNIAFNDGALSAGNNSALEYFLIQDGVDAKLVIETSVYGSANTNLEGVTASESSLNAAVITLTGVSIDDLQVSNGAIIYA